MNHEQRHYLAQYLDVIDAETNEQIGYLGDISEQGLMFITELSVPTDAIKDVYIQNNIVSKDESQLSVKAKIKTLWEKPNINPKLLCIGCSILEIGAEDHQQLKALVETLSYGSDLEIHRTLKDN